VSVHGFNPDDAVALNLRLNRCRDLAKPAGSAGILPACAVLQQIAGWKPAFPRFLIVLQGSLVAFGLWPNSASHRLDTTSPV